MSGLGTGWDSLPGTFPWPPMNVQVLSPFFIGALDIRWDDPATIATGAIQITTQASGYIILTGIPKTLLDASASITILSTVTVGETINIGGVIYTAVSGARHPGLNDFEGDAGTTQLIAQSLTDAINDAANGLAGSIIASTTGSVITLDPLVQGSEGNDIVLTSASVNLSILPFSGGVDADTITIGGVVILTAVAGARTSGLNDFSIASGNTFDIAQSVADALNDPLNLFSGLVTATALYGKVTLTAVPIGDKGNTIAIESSDDTIFTVTDYLTGGEGDGTCLGKTNSSWNIVGVNIYRSDNGERGPYIRINRFPIGSLFYRDLVDNILIEDEIVDWNSAWVIKGDGPNDRQWTFRTIQCPVVKKTQTPVTGLNPVIKAVNANSPSDVIVKINGVVTPVHNVFGPNGEITLINQYTYDPATERNIPALIPGADTTVTVTYWYNKNNVKTSLDRDYNTFYRLTTVAIDPTGESPTGYIETPLGYSPPASVAMVETLDYIWREAVRRNRWILEQGGERVKLFKQKVSGIPCPCRVDERTLEWMHQPRNRCVDCLGTGWVGGYDGPIDIIIAPDDAERKVSQTPNGRRLEHQSDVWTGPSPIITQRDLIIKQTGERYSVGPVRRPTVRGLYLQQHFNVAYLDEQDIRYKIPVNGTQSLPWPETRYTDPNTPCKPADPYPVGFDYQATPMETENPNVPDGREIRGRTPVWANISKGGSTI